MQTFEVRNDSEYSYPKLIIPSDTWICFDSITITQFIATSFLKSSKKLCAKKSPLWHGLPYEPELNDKNTTLQKELCTVNDQLTRRLGDKDNPCSLPIKQCSNKKVTWGFTIEEKSRLAWMFCGDFFGVIPLSKTNSLLGFSFSRGEFKDGIFMVSKLSGNHKP